METNLERIEIILCDTQDGANIGASCRAMKTMGIEHLTLATQNTYDEDRIKTLAIHAYDLYENRKQYKTLNEALENSVLSIAATRRHGKLRKTRSVTPAELAEIIYNYPQGKISIVFGCESSGLTDEQVHACSMIVTIPTSPAFPSLNLSQSVQIICYELFQKLKKYPSSGNVVPMERTEEASDKIIKALETIAYFKSPEELNYTKEFLRDQFSRAHLTESEVQRFEKIFEKSTKIIKHKLS